jgi:hypothetical protein
MVRHIFGAVWPILLVSIIALPALSRDAATGRNPERVHPLAERHDPRAKSQRYQAMNYSSGRRAQSVRPYLTQRRVLEPARRRPRKR